MRGVAVRRWIALLVGMMATVAYGANITYTTPSGFQLHFTTGGAGATLSSITATSSDSFVEVPASVTDAGISYSVTAIAARAFFNCGTLTGVSLPEGVQSVGTMAFYNCTALDSILLPSTLTSIGTAAFSQTAYMLDEENWIGGMLTIGNYLIAMNCAGLPGTVRLPEGMLGVGAFASGTSCGAIRTLHLPSTLRFISDMAFTGCTSIDTLVVDAEVPPALGYDVFVSEGMQVVVPCQSLALYTAAQRWGDLSFAACEVQGIGMVDDEGCATVTGERGGILVQTDAGREVRVYDAKGVLRAAGSGAVSHRFQLSKGIYFVRLSHCGGRAVVVH